MFLDDARAECCGDTPARIEIQMIEPRRTALVDNGSCRVPATVEWRCEQRVGVRRTRDGATRLVDDRGKVVLELRWNRIGRRRGADWQQRTFELDGRRAGRVESGRVKSDCALTDPARNTLLEATRERLEIARGAGTEFPRVVDRQQHFGRCRRQYPCGREVGIVPELRLRDRQAESCFASELERRHDAGNVIGVVRQVARTEQPRQGELGSLAECCVERGFRAVAGRDL
jgi:hypothetical protein